MSGRGCVYLLDTNVLIQAYLRYYGFDLVPRFWSELVKYVQNGRIKSIDRVLNEIYKKDDDLKKWVNEKIEQCFEDTNRKDVLDEYASLISWAQNQNYTTGAKNNFVKVDNADAWVVAYAKVYFNVRYRPSFYRNRPPAQVYEARVHVLYFLKREAGRVGNILSVN